jgi:hypothetical protein
MSEESFNTRLGYCPDGAGLDAAGWVLGALDPVAARNFAEHLLGCQICRLAVEEFQPAAWALLTHSTLQPPEHLAAAILARVRRSASRA